MLYRAVIYCECENDTEAADLLDDLANVACGGLHLPEDPEHECGREFAAFVGQVEAAPDWAGEFDRSFAALLPGEEE